MLKITCDGPSTSEAKIETLSGQEVQGVSGLVIRMEPNDVVRAEISVCVAAVDVMAHPLLDLETIKQAAAVHGFRLVPASEG